MISVLLNLDLNLNLNGRLGVLKKRNCMHRPLLALFICAGLCCWFCDDGG
jgi:hypothetical protein